MTSSSARIRAFKGMPLFSYGFRPFFLAGGLWAALAMAISVAYLSGLIELTTHLTALDWHAHEMIFGYVPAVAAGFLLTAIPNWTGRLPVVGTPLAILVSIWLAGRIAIAFSLHLGAAFSAGIDALFLLALTMVIGREIVAGNNAHNLKVLFLLGAFSISNIIFHLETLGYLSGGYGRRLGVSTVLLLIMLIGGRIIPSFTRNWLAKQAFGKLPISFNFFDAGVIGVSGIALTFWILLPLSEFTVAATALAAMMNVVRLSRWAGERTVSEPLVFVLHVAFAFVPVGFALLSLAIARPHVIPSSVALHGWTAGGMGLMTLAVMTRATLGHTQRPLTAGIGTSVLYLFIVLATFARILAAFSANPEPMIYFSAAVWIAAFVGFLALYGPLLACRRSLIRSKESS